VRRNTGDAPGPWTLLLRDVAHLLDTASIVGWLWPLWDSRRRTFADMLTRTEVRLLEPDAAPPHVRRWSAVAVSSAVVACLAGVAISFFVAYSADRATDQTRAQIATQGPKMVAQMLTYDPKSLHDDFTRALALATDKYRPQLAAQQDVVQKGTPVINEYWVTNSSIESAGPDRATMLLFMQGRRGVGPEQRYISATVQVKFAKGGGNAWRVDDLNVLTKPKQPGGGK
jgi:Mce-associated membrane protein